MHWKPHLWKRRAEEANAHMHLDESNREQEIECVYTVSCFILSTCITRTWYEEIGGPCTQRPMYAQSRTILSWHKCRISLVCELFIWLSFNSKYLLFLFHGSQFTVSKVCTSGLSCWIAKDNSLHSTLCNTEWSFCIDQSYLGMWNMYDFWK